MSPFFYSFVCGHADWTEAHTSHPCYSDEHSSCEGGIDWSITHSYESSNQVLNAQPVASIDVVIVACLISFEAGS